MDASGTEASPLMAALGASQDAVVVLEVTPRGHAPDFAVVACNPRGPALLGLAVGGRVGALAPGTAQSLIEMCAATLADGVPRSDEGQPGPPGGGAEWIDRQVVRLSADQVALTLRDVTARQRDHERLRRSEAASQELAGEQAALRRATEAVAHDEPPESVIALITQEIARLLRADCATVARFDDDAIVTVGAWGGDGSRPGARYPRDGDRSLARVARSGAPARADYAALRRDDPVSARIVPAGYAWGISAPIRAGSRLWGGLLVVRGTGGEEFSDADEERLTRFADLIGLAVFNSEAERRLRALAATDPLTGLANHRAFQERMVEEVARSRRHRQPLSLVLLDLDHFKSVNDAHGHQVGDAVLAEIASRLLESARADDLVARVGGEEFAWLVPGTDAAGAEVLAERARRRVEAEPFPRVGVLTASLGVADLGSGEGGESLFRHADLALIWTKLSGRNRCARHSPDLIRRLAVRRAELRAEEEPGRLPTIRALATLVDAGDPHRQRHSERVADLADDVAGHLGWSLERRALLREVALVHDVGKISVPEEILRRAGPLDAIAEERLRAHAALGAEIAGRALTAEQMSWVRGHHEWWDGRGYPDGLARRAIPEGARIIAVADAWDAMTSARPWRPAHSVARALAEMRAGAGSQFWPEAAGALIAVTDPEGEAAPARTGLGVGI